MTADTIARKLAGLAPWVTTKVVDRPAEGPCSQCTDGPGQVHLLWSMPDEPTTHDLDACGPCAIETLRHEIGAGCDWADAYVCAQVVDLGVAA